jgi:hypothetical protein
LLLAHGAEQLDWIECRPRVVAAHRVSSAPALERAHVT